MQNCYCPEIKLICSFHRRPYNCSFKRVGNLRTLSSHNISTRQSITNTSGNYTSGRGYFTEAYGVSFGTHLLKLSQILLNNHHGLLTIFSRKDSLFLGLQEPSLRVTLPAAALTTSLQSQPVWQLTAALSPLSSFFTENTRKIKPNASYKLCKLVTTSQTSKNLRTIVLSNFKSESQLFPDRKFTFLRDARLD